MEIYRSSDLERENVTHFAMSNGRFLSPSLSRVELITIIASILTFPVEKNSVENLTD